VLKSKKYNRKFIENMTKKHTSCGGTSNVTVRKSTLKMLSTHGKMKNKPGPFAPPKKMKD
jgi:hypothetical protein